MSLLQRIAFRFKGIPLKGETHAPKSFFEDCDKEFYAPTRLPKLSKDFKEHPERDLVNFPYPELREYPPKTRMFMIPDSWCTPFHKITGTSVRLDKYLHEKYTEKLGYYDKIIAEELKDATSAAETKSLKAVQESFPTIFKENLALQLEATFRKNVETVTNELKRRLDYLKEVEATKQRFERDIFLKSINEGVLQQITNNEGNIKDKYLENCIVQLNTISTKNY